MRLWHAYNVWLLSYWKCFEIELSLNRQQVKLDTNAFILLEPYKLPLAKCCPVLQ